MAIFNINGNGRVKYLVTLHGGYGDVITLTNNKQEYTVELGNSTKKENFEIKAGTYTINSNLLEENGIENMKVNIDRNTTEIYAMPNGTIVYWYGYKPYTPKAVRYAPDVENITSNTKAPDITPNTSSIMIRQPADYGYYIGSAIFDDVKTDGGVLTFKSSGKSANNSDPKVYFSYAKSIKANGFTPISSNYVDYGEKETTLGTAAAGTYDIAISVQNGGLSFHGQVTVYAVYFAK